MALPILHLQEIPRDGLSLSCDVAADELALGPDDGRIQGDLALSAQVLKAGSVVHVSGLLTGTVRRQCVRCLKEYDEALRLPVTGEFHPSTQDTAAAKPRRHADRVSSEALAKEDRLRRVPPKSKRDHGYQAAGLHKDAELKKQSDKPADRGDSEGAESESDELYAYSGEEIALDGMLREQVILDAPMQPLCREDCRGLCPVCGQDRNERRCDCREQEQTSPFAVLATLRDQMNADPARKSKPVRRNCK